MILRSTFKLTALFLFFLVLFSGCAKESGAPKEETPATPTTLTSPKFSWTVGGGTLTNADDAYYVSQFSNIYATKTNGMSVDIVLEDLTKGTHAIAPSNGITLVYTTSTATMNASSGSVVISENTGTSVSGSFTCNLQGGGSSTSIKGDFSALPKK